jgi:fructokinase
MSYSYNQNLAPSYICCFGEILWDLLPSGKLPGGAPMNVAIHLQNLGLNSKIISRIGNDELGREICQFIESKNCSTDLIQKDETHGTGNVTVTLNEKKEANYDIVQPIAWDFIGVSNENTLAAEDAKAIVFGTLAARHKTSRHTLLSFLALPITKIYDVNFRAPFAEKSLVEELLSLADIVKMNEDELAIIAEWNELQAADDDVKMLLLKEIYGLQILIVTRGENGAAVITNDVYHQSKGYQVKVADTIGSGDAFLAGFLKNHFAGKSIDYSLKYACALGAVVASHHGANPEISETEVLAFLNS